jgi:hypothetical protein
MRTKRQAFIVVAAALMALYASAALAAEDKKCKKGGFPATGQTTSFRVQSDDDGGIQAGATLSYTDNGDGTLTDDNTCLVWEKQTIDGSIHDMDNTYTWADAFDVHVAGLNAANFAGHDDWRLPNVKELLSIIDYENFGPAVAPAFQNASCTSSNSVLTASCTRGEIYWSSTTTANNPNFAPTFAYFVNFRDGFVFVESKSGVNSSRRVRAVRGGAALGSSQ